MGAWGVEWRGGEGSGVGWDRRIQYDTANCTWLATAVHSTVYALRTARCWWCCTQAKKKKKSRGDGQGKTRRDERRDDTEQESDSQTGQDRQPTQAAAAYTALAIRYVLCCT